MVRLKVYVGILEAEDRYEFQFQNGTIKRYNSIRLAVSGSEFQFQNGTIKSGKPETYQITFNEFQFQNGTIKRHFLSLLQLIQIPVSIPKWYD